MLFFGREVLCFFVLEVLHPDVLGLGSWPEKHSEYPESQQNAESKLPFRTLAMAIEAAVAAALESVDVPGSSEHRDVQQHVSRRSYVLGSCVVLGSLGGDLGGL